jgi:hypothetical protein
MSMLRYAMTIYPSTRWSEEQLKQSSLIWASEFADKACDLVAAAFKLARKDSPDWLPSVPRIQEAIEKIENDIKMQATKELEDYKASHCGKTKEEWEAMRAWETSKDGKQKILEYKRRFATLLDNLT